MGFLEGSKGELYKEKKKMVLYKYVVKSKKIFFNLLLFTPSRIVYVHLFFPFYFFFFGVTTAIIIKDV